MFDFNYNESVGFVPYVSVMKEQNAGNAEEVKKTQKAVKDLSKAVATQSESVAENSAAIADNTAAIADESAAREAAVEELNQKIDEVPKFKIEVVDSLPAEGDSATIYLLKVSEEEGNLYEEYVYSNGAWEKLGPMLDLSGYATKEEMEAALAGVYTKDEVDALIAPLAVKEEVEAALALKADADTVYTKDEADAKFLTEHQDISNLATKTEVEEAVAPLAVKDDVDAALAEKANADDVYTKDEADGKFLTEHQDISNLATKTEVEEGLAAKANADEVYTKNEADAKFLTEHQDISDLATKAEVEAGVAGALAAAGAVASDLANEVSAREQAIADLHEEIVALPKFKILIVEQLPGTGDTATLYLVATGDETGNTYTEYVYVNNAWEEIGTQSLDLSEYAKVEDLDTLSGRVEDMESELASIDEKLIGLAEANALQDEVIATKADANNVYTKEEADAKFIAEHQDISGKVDKNIDGANGKALIFNESDGGGAKFEHNDGTWSFAGVNDGGENGIAGQIYALKKNASNKMEGARIDVTKNGMFYTVGDASAADRMVSENEIATKGDMADLATKAEVEAVDAKVNAIDLTPYAEATAVTAEIAAASSVLAAKDAEQDAAIALKADASEVYTKTETGELLATKVDQTTYDAFYKDYVAVKKLVGGLGANVSWSATSKSELTTLLQEGGGIVNLTVDITEEDGMFQYVTPTFGSNTKTLNLRGHDIITSGRNDGSMFTLRADQVLTITNGGNITNTNTYGSREDNKLHDPVFVVKSAATLNLAIGSSKSATTTVNDPVVVCQENGTINIGSGNYSSPNSCVIYCMGGIINISGGTFRSTSAEEGSAFLINCLDSAYSAGDANIVVFSTSKTSGPKFWDFNPADNNTEGEHTNFVREDCEVQISTVVEDEVEHTIYTVVKKSA